MKRKMVETKRVNKSRLSSIFSYSPNLLNAKRFPSLRTFIRVSNFRQSTRQQTKFVHVVESKYVSTREGFDS